MALCTSCHLQSLRSTRFVSDLCINLKVLFLTQPVPMCIRRSGASRKELAAILVLLYEQRGELRAPHDMLGVPTYSSRTDGTTGRTSSGLARSARSLHSPSIHVLIPAPCHPHLTNLDVLRTLDLCVREVDHIFNYPLDLSLSEREPLVPKGCEDGFYSEEFHVRATYFLPMWRIEDGCFSFFFFYLNLHK
jgi:hypothetical protein